MSSSLVFKPPKRINLKKPSNNQLVIENKNNNSHKVIHHKKTKSSTFSNTNLSKGNINLFPSDPFTTKQIQNLQDELGEYKIKSEQFQKEIKTLNDKIKNANSALFHKKTKSASK